MTASVTDERPPPPGDDSLIEPGEGGYPDDPQPCQLGDHPAIKSILFRDGEAYVPTCSEHEDEARAQLTSAEEQIAGEVAISPDAVTAAAQTDSAEAVAPEPVEVVAETDGEMAVRFPVVVIEGLDTSDGRFITADALSFRALPISLLAQIQSAHGGDDPGPAVLVGRIDTLVRTPGPDVISKRTGEPFPEGSYVWSGTGAVSTTAMIDGHNVADLVRRRYLRGVSVDLAGMDYEILGEEGGLALDADNPRRQLVTHSAEIAAATLVPIPAFGDAYVELADETEPPAVVPADDFPEGLIASAFPAWRSPEVGDRVAIVASAPRSDRVSIPDDAAEQLAEFIASGEGEQRDAQGLAVAIVDYIGQTWQPTDEEEGPPDEPPAGEEVVMAAADTPVLEIEPVGDMPDEVGMPDAPQPCEMSADGEHPAVRSLLFASGEQYVAVCAEHEQEARDLIEADGGEVTQVVEIAAPDDEEEVVPDELEVIVASASKADAPSECRSRVRPRRVAPGWTPSLTAAAPVVEDVYLDEIPDTAAGGRERPPLAWFTDPEFDAYTPITIEGRRVYGHIGPWNKPHIGYNGKPVYLPKSRSNYREFLRGGVRVVDESGNLRIAAVGHLTADAPHAGSDFGARATARHYDHSGYSWAHVAAGDDEFGVWVNGILRPGVSDGQIDTALAHPPSGDWRPIGGHLELVGVLCVNVPGFGVDRARVASGELLSLVASGDLQPQRVGEDGVARPITAPLDVPEASGAVVLDYDTLADAIAGRLDERRQAGELAALHADLVADLDDTPAVVASLLAEVDDTKEAAARLFAELADESFGGDADPKGLTA